jgi:hypothetical protein
VSKPEPDAAQEQSLLEGNQDVEPSPIADQEAPVETLPIEEHADVASQSTPNEEESQGSESSAVEDAVSEPPVSEEVPEPETVTSSDPPSTENDDKIEDTDAGEVGNAESVVAVAESDNLSAEITGESTFGSPLDCRQHGAACLCYQC